VVAVDKEQTFDQKDSFGEFENLDEPKIEVSNKDGVEIDEGFSQFDEGSRGEGDAAQIINPDDDVGNVNV
jgi:hypothetical protein